MNKLKHIGAMIAFAMLSIFANAQAAAATSPQGEDFMRSNGKVYVVMAVVVTIVVGLFVYLITLDRKISKLERRS